MVVIQVERRVIGHHTRVRDLIVDVGWQGRHVVDVLDVSSGNGRRRHHSRCCSRVINCARLDRHLAALVAHGR